MEECNKEGKDGLRQLVHLHHDAIIQLIQMLKKRQEEEASFWKSLLKHLKESEMRK